MCYLQLKCWCCNTLLFTKIRFLQWQYLLTEELTTKTTLNRGSRSDQQCKHANTCWTLLLPLATPHCISSQLMMSPWKPTTMAINQCSWDAAVGTHVNKGSPYSITECRVSELIPVLGSQPAGDVSHKPHYFLPGLQLPSQPLRGLLWISLLGEQRHNGCE